MAQRTPAGIPAWLNPRTGEPEEKLRTNIYRSNNGKGLRVRFRGPDPLTGDRVQRSKQFPPGTTPEELEHFLAYCDRAHEVWKLVRRHLRREGWPEAHGRRADPRDRHRSLLAAKWVRVETGIDKSAHGWRARGRETDPVTLERVPWTEVFRTATPPGDSEPPPAHVRRYRDQRQREGLEGKLSRRDLPKKNVRALRIAPAPAPSFAVQFKRLLEEAGLSLIGAQNLFKPTGKATIIRHLNGDRPTARLRVRYEERLTKRLGRTIKLVPS